MRLDSSTLSVDSAVSGWVVDWRKAVLDRAIGALLFVPGLLALVPMLLWSAVSFKANPIFLQRRVGLGGKSFGMLKLRTLPTTTPQDLDRGQLDEEHQASGIARLLRATHLDELPQIWHVFSGEMSLVGPRPMIESIVDGLEPEFRNFREVARPGLTGLWQVSVCGAQRFERYDPLDVAYLQAATPKLDVRIIWWTILQVFGAHRLTARQIENAAAVRLDFPSDPHSAARGERVDVLKPAAWSA